MSTEGQDSQSSFLKTTHNLEGVADFKLPHAEQAKPKPTKIKTYSGDDPTPGQTQKIAKLCMVLGIKESEEDLVRNKMEAGYKLRDLNRQLRLRNERLKADRQAKKSSGKS